MSESDSASSSKLAQSRYEKKLRAILSKRGYAKSTKIVDTLQGTIWRSTQQATNKPVVIKITSKELTSESSVVVDGTKIKIDENILKEKNILKHLSSDAKCPNSITKYIDFMKRFLYIFHIILAQYVQY